MVFLCVGLFHQENASRYLLEEYWTQPGSMESAVELVRQEGWAGLGLDNEASAQSDARLPGLLASFIGNLSTALHAAGFRLVVDVTSTWHRNIAGPEYLPLYGRAAAPSTVFMDMATYFNGRPNGMSMAETLAKVRNAFFVSPFLICNASVCQDRLGTSVNMNCKRCLSCQALCYDWWSRPRGRGSRRGNATWVLQRVVRHSKQLSRLPLEPQRICGVCAHRGGCGRVRDRRVSV
eukprot:COSAG06_NODE_313_length_17764_cov_4.287235_11_plen_235_part_00